MSKSKKKTKPAKPKTKETAASTEDGLTDADDSTFAVKDRRFWARAEDDSNEEISESKPTMVLELETKVAEQESQIQKLRDFARQLKNEHKQSVERMEKQMQKDLRKRQAPLLLQYLEVVDNLERSLHAAQADLAEPTPHEKSMLEGIELVKEQMHRILASADVSEISAVEQPFDPELHEAIATAEVEDASLDGCVTQEYLKGYTYAGEVLRPSRVCVGKASADSAVQPETASTETTKS